METKINAAASVAVISLESLRSLNEAPMTVHINGQPTSWQWTFAGPGHEKAQAQTDRLLIEGRRRAANPRYKSDMNAADHRAENARFVAERLIDWTPVSLEGKILEFSEAAAIELLSDPRQMDLLRQGMEFLGDDASFRKTKLAK